MVNKYYNEMREKQFVPNTTTFNSMLDAFGKKGNAHWVVTNNYFNVF